MQTPEQIFNASQYILLNVVSKISEIHENLQNVDIYVARTNLAVLRQDLGTLDRLINALEAAEYGRENIDEFEDEEDYEESTLSTSTSESSSSSSSSTTEEGEKED